MCTILAPAVMAADYYPLQVGNQWTYTMSNGMPMSTKVTGFVNVGSVRCAVVETNMGGQIGREYIAADADGVKTHMGQTMGMESRYNPPVVRIKLPYKQGDTWTATVNQFGMTVTTTSESIGSEQVQTPAGTFDCIRIRTSATTMPPMVSTIWYAPGVGPVKQFIQTTGQELTATLASTNVKPAPQAQAAPAPATTTAAKNRCPKCGAEIPPNARFCPSCGEKIAVPAATSKPGDATTTAARPDPNQPGLEKYQSPDGKVLLYKPKGWTVDQGDMFGQGTYGVTVMEPQENAVVLFITFPATDQIKDSIALAAKCIAGLRAKYPDLQATSINSTPDRVRTLADISLTAEGEKGQGHGYFFRTPDAASVYVLLAKAAKWNELRPTLTTVAANLAYAPQGVAAVQEQGQKLAEESKTDAGPVPPLMKMIKDALAKPGKQVTLQSATLPDQSMSIEIPQGWTLKGQKLQYAATSSEQTSSHGVCSVYHTILPVDFPMQGVINVRYQDPPQALETALQFGKLGRGVQVLAEMPTETGVPELAQSIQQQRAQGFQVDSRLMHVRFTNVLTGAATRALFIVQCSTRGPTPVWQLSVNGSWAPDGEYDEWLPAFLRIGRTVKVNPQWLQGELRNQAATQQQLNRNLQKSIAESQQAFDSYMDSVRDGERSRDYTSHMWSQTTLGQGSWVAENEGAKVYNTDSWGIEGPEGRIDSPAYNTANFDGTNPWTGRDLELVDTRAEYEKYIANQ